MRYLGDYNIEAFPESRIATLDIGAASQMKHHIKALLQIDVTDARRMISEKKEKGKSITFNSWLIKCISKAVEGSKEIHGIRKGKRKVVIFEDIDISIMIEREIKGERVPLPYVIRKTNEKSISEICDEIRRGQEQPIADEGNYVLGDSKNEYVMKAYYTMPSFVRRIIWERIVRSPFLTKQSMGTVMITSIGAAGRIDGWVIPVSVHPLCFAVGSIIEKPGVEDGRIEIREYLHMTASVDHDVIDGAPAVRILAGLVDLAEKEFDSF